MATYNTKYQIPFADNKGNIYRIELRQKDYIGAITELKGQSTVLEYIFPQTQKYEALKSVGADINVIAQTDRQLLDLYTADYKEWIVVIVKNNVVDFLGYVEPELYEQSLRTANNYPVSIVVNNGINILEREKYLKPDETQYRGLSNKFKVLTHVIEKITVDLPISQLFISSQIRVNSSTGSVDHCVLEELVVNEDNYIDEDENPFDCKKVLQAILSPLNLSLFILGDSIWVVSQAELGISGPLNVYKYYISGANGQVSTVSAGIEQHVIPIKNISNLVISDMKFSIKAGYNNYILTKNRYVKEIIELIDFNSKDIAIGDPNLSVFHCGGLHQIGGQIISKYWVSYSVGDTNFNFAHYNINESPFIVYQISIGAVDYIVFADGYNWFYRDTPPNMVAFAGGIKPMEVIDDVPVHYTADGNEFSNWIFVTNAFFDVRTCIYFFGIETPPGYIPPNGTELVPYPLTASGYYNDRRKTAFTYEKEVPYTFSSNEVLIQLSFTFKVIGNGDDNRIKVFYNTTTGGWTPVRREYTEGEYAAFMIPVQIYLRDKDNQVIKYLSLSQSYTYPGDVQDKDYLDADYRWIDSTTIKDTVIFVSKKNDLGEPMNCIDEELTVTLNIPADFETIAKLRVVFFNTILRAEYNPTTNIWQSKSDFLDNMPLIAFKDIQTQLIDAATKKPIEIQDEEINYYLSESYKTQKTNEEVINFTADKKYITDLGSIVKSDTFENNIFEYINVATIANITKTNLEDIKGQLFINDYSKNKIMLSLEIRNSTISPFDIFVWTGDTLWNTKKWAVIQYTHDVVNGKINVLLENYN